MEREIQEMAAD